MSVNWYVPPDEREEILAELAEGYRVVRCAGDGACPFPANERDQNMSAGCPICIKMKVDSEGIETPYEDPTQ